MVEAQINNRQPDCAILVQIFDREEEKAAIDKYWEDLESTGIFAQIPVSRHSIGPTSEFSHLTMI